MWMRFTAPNSIITSLSDRFTTDIAGIQGSQAILNVSNANTSTALQVGNTTAELNHTHPFTLPPTTAPYSTQAHLIPYPCNPTPTLSPLPHHTPLHLSSPYPVTPAPTLRHCTIPHPATPSNIALPPDIFLYPIALSGQMLSHHSTPYCAMSPLPSPLSDRSQPPPPKCLHPFSYHHLLTLLNPPNPATTSFQRTPSHVQQAQYSMFQFSCEIYILHHSLFKPKSRI